MTAHRARLGLTVVLALLGLLALRRGEPLMLVGGVNLGVHETGHLVFAPFGEWWGFAGGTILELAFPLVFAGYFLRRGDAHAASVALWWEGQALLGVARYVADARAQDLPLVGGGEHDWLYLLADAGRLPQDLAIARGVRAAALVATVLAVLWGLVAARRAEPAIPEPALRGA